MKLRIRNHGMALLACLAVFIAANALGAPTDVQTDCPTDPANKPDPNCVQSIQDAINACKTKKGQRADCDTQCDFYMGSKQNMGRQSLAANVNSCFSNAALGGQLGPITSVGGWKDLMDQATNFRSQVVSIHDSVSQKREKARQQKEIVMMNCVDEKLQKIRGLMTLAKQAIESLGKAMDRDAAAHEVKRLEIIYQKCNELKLEADQCVGSEASYVGNTTVGLEIDPNIPSEDPTEPPLPLPDVTRPPSASPFE